ncbi:uncharacterized protein LOC111913001 [Lactuca sativa]|uniref:uncharacterized protein LOC111913001 n=1 Tax=Lactuca sativa TaxID=4236 RepID=UPI000CD9509B|nr:uncharacterized protein LOC111913001 [Lactuca sativa]
MEGGHGANYAEITRNGASANPNTIKDHCDFHVNSYYQKKGQVLGSCDLSGTVTVSQTPPSGADSMYFNSNTTSNWNRSPNPRNQNWNPKPGTRTETGTLGTVIGTGTGTPGTGTENGTPGTETGTGMGTRTGSGTVPGISVNP